jgi:D-3-phosphoglycerate dehydrogenase / 2-oxoglutarate reductase
MQIQITTSSFGKAGDKPVQFLKENNIHFKLNPYERRLTENEAIEVIQNAEGVIAGTEPLTRKVLDQLPKLKVISRCGVGTNNVDMEATKEKGIKVYNTPSVHVDAVAELTLTGVLNTMRRISAADQNIRNGQWKKNIGNSLFDKRIGLIGFGQVARRFSKLATVFTNDIVYHDPFVEVTPSDYPAKQSHLEELLTTSDIISIHIPLTDENYHLIGKKEFKKMKPNSLLVNTSRGGLIDEEALYDFLKTNPEASAYLDVFENEPYNGKLKNLQNILMTPHIGTSSKETRCEMEYQACVNLLKGLKNE